MTFSAIIMVFVAELPPAYSIAPTNRTEISSYLRLASGLRIHWLYPPWRGNTLHIKRNVLCMTLNCIWWWGSNSGDLSCNTSLALLPGAVVYYCDTRETFVPLGLCCDPAVVKSDERKKLYLTTLRFIYFHHLQVAAEGRRVWKLRQPR